jgi:hypothetical protein
LCGDSLLEAKQKEEDSSVNLHGMHMSKTTYHGRMESILFYSFCDIGFDAGGQVAGFVGCGHGGLDIELSMHHSRGSI